MERNPLWIGEVDIVRAIFGHAAHADPGRLRRIAPQAMSGHARQISLEERIPRRRLDVLVRFGHGSGGGDQYLVVEAKVGAVVDFGTLAEYLDKVHAAFGQAAGLLIAAYKPVGKLPPGWAYQDLEEVANLLSCRGGDGSLTCQVCEEIRYAVVSSAASKAVTEWRALAQATASANIPDEWIVKGSGSSVGRPLVFFQSQWLDGNKDCYVQVEVGNNYGLPAASVMIVAMASPLRRKSPSRIGYGKCWSRPPKPRLLFLTASPTPAPAAGVPEDRLAQTPGVSVSRPRGPAASVCKAGMDEDGRSGTATETTPRCSLPLSNRASHYSGSRNVPWSSQTTPPELSR